VLKKLTDWNRKTDRKFKFFHHFFQQKISSWFNQLTQLLNFENLSVYNWILKNDTRLKFATLGNKFKANKFKANKLHSPVHHLPPSTLNNKL
jgi:hypothetical protein